jgi:hypothetical protein
VRHAKDGGQLAVRSKQRFDTFSQLGFRCAFAFQYPRLLSGIRGFNDCLENKLNALFINGHGTAPEQLISLLSPDATACKPQARAGALGLIAAELPAQVTACAR